MPIMRIWIWIIFFKGISLPSLKTNEKGTLETCVLETEVISAIKALSNGKTPGSDGYNIEFSKSFQDILTPFLTMLFNDIISKQSMPMSMRSAHRRKSRGGHRGRVPTGISAYEQIAFHKAPPHKKIIVSTQKQLNNNIVMFNKSTTQALQIINLKLFFFLHC